MRATRIETVAIRPPDTIQLELSIEEANQLRTLLGYNVIIPETIYKKDTTDDRREALSRFMQTAYRALWVVVPKDV